jgi:hypothetical protein
MKMNASISLDLDNQWAYMKVHGDDGWDKFPTYFDKFIPHGLEMLNKHKLKITFFIVGRDAEAEENRSVLSEITKNEHEVGNHSFNHEAWFHLYSDSEIISELERTEEAIERATKQIPRGFRGPGFSRSKSLYNILKKKNYLYDASSLPTWIGPLARAYYFRQSDLSPEERKTREGLFGSFKDGFKPIKPFYWSLDDNKELLEIPVSTMPILKLPFHFSYLHYLANINVGLMNSYLQTAISLCKMTKTEPSFLLHPLDIIGGDLIPELKFFPGMELSSNYKSELFDVVLHKLKDNFNLINMSDHAEIIMKTDDVPKRKPA